MTHSQETLLLWSRRLEALFPQPGPNLEGTGALTIGEGLSLPTAGEALAAAVPRELIVRELHDTVEWLRRVLRPERIDAACVEDLIGVRGALLGLDAILGVAGATAEGQPLQVAVTARRLHVRTRLPPSAVGGSRPESARNAAGFATAIFQTDDAWSRGGWQVEDFLGLGCAFRDSAFVPDWPASCLIVTDGSAVKFSFLKIRARECPPARESGARIVAPWFPVESPAP